MGTDSDVIQAVRTSGKQAGENITKSYRNLAEDIETRNPGDSIRPAYGSFKSHLKRFSENPLTAECVSSPHINIPFGEYSVTIRKVAHTLGLPAAEEAELLDIGARHFAAGYKWRQYSLTTEWEQIKRRLGNEGWQLPTFDNPNPAPFTREAKVGMGLGAGLLLTASVAALHHAYVGLMGHPNTETGEDGPTNWKQVGGGAIAAAITFMGAKHLLTGRLRFGHFTPKELEYLLSKETKVVEVGAPQI